MNVGKHSTFVRFLHIHDPLILALKLCSLWVGTTTYLQLLLAFVRDEKNLWRKGEEEAILNQLNKISM